MVIQDDAEFKDFINMQDRIVDRFIRTLGLADVQPRNDYYKEDRSISALSENGLPSPNFVLGRTFKQITRTLVKNGKLDLTVLKKVEYLSPSDIPAPKPQRKTPPVVELPRREALYVKIKKYKQGSKSVALAPVMNDCLESFLEQCGLVPQRQPFAPAQLHLPPKMTKPDRRALKRWSGASLAAKPYIPQTKTGPPNKAATMNALPQMSLDSNAEKSFDRLFDQRQ